MTSEQQYYLAAVAAASETTTRKTWVNFQHLAARARSTRRRRRHRRIKRYPLCMQCAAASQKWYETPPPPSLNGTPRRAGRIKFFYIFVIIISILITITTVDILFFDNPRFWRILWISLVSMECCLNLQNNQRLMRRSIMIFDVRKAYTYIAAPLVQYFFLRLGIGAGWRSLFCFRERTSTPRVVARDTRAREKESSDVGARHFYITPSFS